MDDLISIIVPVYNVEKYLDRCIESIVNQTYQNLEIILIDDGSTDSSGKKCNEWVKKDNRIKVIHKENFGAPSARNKGIDSSTGKYIMFFDSDDELYGDAIENMLNSIKDADLIMGNWSFLDSDENMGGEMRNFDNQIYDKDALKKIAFCNPFPGNKLYRSKIIKENNIYFDNVRIGQDLNFYIKYIYFCNKFATIENLVFKYRVINNSISKTYNFNIFDIVNSIEKANHFLTKNSNRSVEVNIMNELKIVHYEAQLNKICNYNRRCRKIILLYFNEELKKIDIKKCSNNIKNKYYKMLIKCKIYKVINPNIIRKLKDRKEKNEIIKNVSKS